MKVIRSDWKVSPRQGDDCQVGKEMLGLDLDFTCDAGTDLRVVGKLCVDDRGRRYRPTDTLGS